MIALPIKYVDYDGTEREDKFYFHLSKAELIRLELTDKDGFKKRLQRLIDAENQQEVWKIVEQIIQMAVGKKSDDGRRFTKSYEAKADFLESEAYTTLIMNLIEDSNYLANFVNGLVATADAGQPVNVPAPVIVK